MNERHVHRALLTDGSGPYLVDGEKVGSLEMLESRFFTSIFLCLDSNGVELSRHGSLSAALAAARELHWV